MQEQPNNPLHGVKLVDMLEYLVANLGWKAMNAATGIRCFINNPTIKSSLKFLRKTPWARQKVEDLYLVQIQQKGQPKSKPKRVLTFKKRGKE